MLSARCAVRPSVARAAPRAASRVARPAAAVVSRAPTRGYADAHAAPKAPEATKATPVQPVPKGYAHATGAEKIQLTMNFYHGPSLSEGPFGTLDNPIIVESSFEHRTVGCEGGPTAADEHELLWHNVWENKPTICVECGQVFALKRLDILEQEEHDHPVH